jgi:hypothetical protein
LAIGLGAVALLTPEAYEEVFAPWRGREVGLLRMDGNAGDQMIDAGARSLFRHFGVSFRDLAWAELKDGGLAEDVDEIAVSGGGNMGRYYPVPYGLRQDALELGRPVTVLPQTFLSLDEDTACYKAVFVREHVSQRLDPAFRLAPDLALAFEPSGMPAQPEVGAGVFLRCDCEGRFSGDLRSLCDPVALCQTADAYLNLAARFEHVVTDRLHFAIAALLLDRKVTLLPNAYFKNRAVFDSWLEALGCDWSDTPPDVDRDEPAARKAIARALAVSTPGAVPRDARLAATPGWQAKHHDGGWVIRHASGGTGIAANPSALLVWELCGHGGSAGQLLDYLIDNLEECPQTIGAEVQELLQDLSRLGAITIDAAGQGRDARPVDAARD